MAPDLDELSYLEEAPTDNVLILINKTKEEIKLFVELAKQAENDGNSDKAQLYKRQMRQQVEFLQRAQRVLGARRLDDTSGT